MIECPVPEIYTRDSVSGLDYALNRYYKPEWGRFTSPDPYQASGGPADPGSWNRYAYVGGDPVNRIDKTGLFHCAIYDGTEQVGWEFCGTDMPVDLPELVPEISQESTGSEIDPCEAAEAAIGNSTILSGVRRVADVVRSVAAATGVSSGLIAVTWFGESSFSTANISFGINLGPGQDQESAIAAGNVDIGPMQINYRWHHQSVPSSQHHEVFGTFNPSSGIPVGGYFDGVLSANVAYGASILRSLMRQFPLAPLDEIAGRYQAGTAPVEKLSSRPLYLRRQALYEKYGAHFDKWLNSNCR